MAEKYQATDEDLPESFWPGRSVPRPMESDARLRAEEIVRRLYPALLGPAPACEHKTATRASLDAESGRKKYVRWKKRAQMWGWLWSLDAQGAFERMNAWEREFARNNLEKFGRWRERTKWVTQAQYDVAANLAAKYLHIPGRGRSSLRCHSRREARSRRFTLHEKTIVTRPKPSRQTAARGA